MGSGRRGRATRRVAGAALGGATLLLVLTMTTAGGPAESSSGPTAFGRNAEAASDQTTSGCTGLSLSLTPCTTTGTTPTTTTTTTIAVAPTTTTAPAPPSPHTAGPMDAAAAAGGATASTSEDLSRPCAGAAPPADPPGGSAWACTFEDEFNGTSLDTSKWQAVTTPTSNYTTGPALSQVCYIDDPSTISESGGMLNLSVTKAARSSNCQRLTMPGFYTRYFGGMVESYQLFSQEYGYFQVRAAMPPTSVPGLQETLWLYPEDENLYGPWPDSGEIDYGEFYSNYPTYDVPAVHYPGSNNDPNGNMPCQLPSGQATAGQFHTYALSWTPTSMTTYYDGTPCMTDVYAPYVTNPDSPPEPFNQPFFLAFTQAFGSYGGDNFRPGSTPLPATMQIDWVRVWQSS